jgi:hypothetical protein
VEDGRILSVMGGGNSTWLGLAVIPAALRGRLASVRSMTDAVHRLAKTGQLRAVPLTQALHVPLPRTSSPSLGARLARWAAGYSMVIAR